MKVYVLFSHIPLRGKTIEGIYFTKEIAEQWLGMYLQDDRFKYYSLDIVEHTVLSYPGQQ